MSTGEKQFRVCVFDSGLGGLSVVRELQIKAPEISVIYCGDNAGFPYGNLTRDQVAERTFKVVAALIERENPDAVIIACNTASTAALQSLREQFDKPFVGTVPAVKPAAESSTTRVISVLATPGTIKRDYTRNLINEFAGDCEVTLVACGRLAKYAEQLLCGQVVSTNVITKEITSAFNNHNKQPTDTVVLGCTHYPLIIDRLKQASPWQVQFIDPTAAIVRRLLDVLSYRPSLKGTEASANIAYVTDSASPTSALESLFLREGFQDLTILPL